MNTPITWNDNELGTLIIRPNARARRLTFRIKPEAIYITVPLQTTPDKIKEVIDQLRPKLQEAQLKRKPRLIDLNFSIRADFFQLELVEGDQAHFVAHCLSNKTVLACPPHTDFTLPKLQEWLRNVIIAALRKQARLILPKRLYQLSILHGMKYKEVKINTSQGRWGSCSTQKIINLSCYLMLLPAHLIDYVLLHELAHTCEMNHGERFWVLLNQMTQQRAEALRQEIKQFHTDF